MVVGAARRLTDVVDGFLVGHRILICDQDGKWTDGFRLILQGTIVLTPLQGPNANAYAERFVRSIRESVSIGRSCLGSGGCSAPSTSSWRTTSGSETIRGSGMR
jgi:hypothetical protein